MANSPDAPNDRKRTDPKTTRDCSDADHSTVNGNATRRQYLSVVAALAAARWASADYDPDDADAWKPPRGIYETGSVAPAALTVSGDATAAAWLLEDDHFAGRTLEVFYDRDAVHLSFEGRAGDLRAGGLAELSTDQARTVAAALYQAAEELDRRREPTGAE